MILIQLKDLCNYDEDFEYEPFLVEEDQDFEKKYKQLLNICETYESFNEIEDFINTNFKKIDYEKRTIEI